MADAALNQRQMLYWRLVAATSGCRDVGASFESMAVDLADRLDLPPAILDPAIGVDVLLHRYPQLGLHFDAIREVMTPDAQQAEATPGKGEGLDLRRTFAYSKLLLNVFGPNTRSASCSAGQYNQWCQDVAALESYLGHPPAPSRPAARGASPASGTSAGGMGGGGAGVRGHAPYTDDRRLQDELVAMESDLIKRMDLREVLKDDRLAPRSARRCRSSSSSSATSPTCPAPRSPTPAG